MFKRKIFLGTIENVKRFTDLVGRHDMEMDLRQGRYVVDAKSIMGIFSLDLISVMELTIYTEDAITAQEIFNSLGKMLIDD